MDGTTPVPYYFQPSLNSMSCFEIHRMIVMIEDAGAIAADNYGVLSALSNGIRVQHVNEHSVVTDLDGGVAIKTNAHWARLCYDMTEHTFGAGSNFVLVRWDFTDVGEPIQLEDTEQFQVTVSDNLTGLTDHHFKIQGRIVR